MSGKYPRARRGLGRLWPLSQLIVEKLLSVCIHSFLRSFITTIFTKQSSWEAHWLSAVRELPLCAYETQRTLSWTSWTIHALILHFRKIPLNVYLTYSLLIMGMHMGEISRLRWLIGFVSHFVFHMSAVTSGFQCPGFIWASSNTFTSLLTQFTLP
jgi:hypothetical protein